MKHHSNLKLAGISLAFASSLAFSGLAFATSPSSSEGHGNTNQEQTADQQENGSTSSDQAHANNINATKSNSSKNEDAKYTTASNKQDNNNNESNQHSNGESNEGKYTTASSKQGTNNHNGHDDANQYGNAENPNAGQKKHDSASHGKWDYKGNQGPEAWGTIASDYHLCVDGREQSPINITQASSGSAQPVIKASYNEAPLSVVNNGHTIQVNYDGKSKFELNGQKYNLKQVHFHSPSEHKVNGKSAPMEIHFVHQNNKGELAVLGVFASQGEENREITKIFSNIPTQQGQQETHQNVSFSPESIIPTDSQAYTYNGSLTTPPCSEKVKWVVYQNPIQVSKEQIKAFKKYFDNNARPTQPINNRQIFSNS